MSGLIAAICLAIFFGFIGNIFHEAHSRSYARYKKKLEKQKNK